MSHYLTNLADILRAVGLTVVEYDGWQTRANKSGGFADDRPWGVSWHHDGANADASNQSRAGYEVSGSPDAPICNIHVMRDASVWVLAAGRTNTNGKGSGVRWSKGAIPQDSMNSYAVGMEISNNGVGQTYPVVQIDAAFTASNAINRAYGNLPTDCATHYQWAPTRKIDPATAAAVMGTWWPGALNASGSWNDDDLRVECERRFQAVPGGDDMAITVFQCNDADAAFVGATSDGVGVHVSWADANMAGRYRAISTVVQQTVSVAQLQSMVLLGRLPEGDGRHEWTGAEFSDWVQ